MVVDEHIPLMLVSQSHAQGDADLGGGAHAVAGMSLRCLEVPQLERPSLPGMSRETRSVPLMASQIADASRGTAMGETPQSLRASSCQRCRWWV